MTPSEIAETLINGNISDARIAIRGTQNAGRHQSAVMAIDVLHELTYAIWDAGDRAGDLGLAWAAAHAQLRRCLTGGT